MNTPVLPLLQIRGLSRPQKEEADMTIQKNRIN
jgi:hypothetical protein